MGQAKLRGTKDERDAAALDAIKQEQARRDHAEMEHNIEVARKWALLTPEEREARLEAAKEEARLYGEMAGYFGHDAARLLMMIDHK